MNDNDLLIEERVRTRLFGPKPQRSGAIAYYAHVARYREAHKADAYLAQAALKLAWRTGTTHARSLMHHHLTPLERTLLALWPPSHCAATAMTWRILRAKLQALDLLDVHGGLAGPSAGDDLACLYLVATARQLAAEYSAEHARAEPQAQEAA